MEKILWLDNDRTYLLPHVARLRMENFYVQRAYNISEAENFLNDGTKWDLIIIDCMLNISEEEEMDENYKPSKTDSGHEAGLAFYLKNKKRIDATGAIACVFTIREDNEIKLKFKNAGLEVHNFKSKTEATDTKIFLEWIKSLLSGVRI